MIMMMMMMMAMMAMTIVMTAIDEENPDDYDDDDDDDDDDVAMMMTWHMPCHRWVENDMKVVHYEPAEGHSQGDLPKNSCGDDEGMMR